MASRRVSSRNRSWFEGLPEPFLVSVLSLLDVATLVAQCSITCKGWRKPLQQEPCIWEASMYELDPAGNFGADAIARVISTRGVDCLEVVRRLGDSTCSKCGNRGAIHVSSVALKRLCDACFTREPRRAGERWKLHINRFFFARPTEKEAKRVTTSDQLSDMVEALNEAPIDELWKNTVVVGKDVDMSEHIGLVPLVEAPMRICGAPGKRPCLTNRISCTIAGCFMVLENLKLVSGLEPEELEEAEARESCECCATGAPLYFPAIEAWYEEARMKSALPTVVVRDCEIHANTGAAIINIGCAASIERCVVSTQKDNCGVSCYMNEKRKPAFAVDIHGCTFTRNRWHVSAGADLSAADEAALRTANTFIEPPPAAAAIAGAGAGKEAEDSWFDGTFKREEGEQGGQVQPWRPGALIGAIRTSTVSSAGAGKGKGGSGSGAGSGGGRKRKRVAGDDDEGY